MFDWRNFWSFFLSAVGIIGVIIAALGVCVTNEPILFLWIVPAIALAAVGFAID